MVVVGDARCGYFEDSRYVNSSSRERWLILQSTIPFAVLVVGLRTSVGSPNRSSAAMARHR